MTPLIQRERPGRVAEASWPRLSSVIQLLLRDLVLRASGSLTQPVNENPSCACGIYPCEVDGSVRPPNPSLNILVTKWVSVSIGDKNNTREPTA